MTDLQRYQALKDKADRLRQRKDEAAGAVKQLMRQLNAEFKVSTVEAARELLKDRKVKSSKLEREFSAALDRFERKWKAKLEEAT